MTEAIQIVIVGSLLAKYESVLADARWPVARFDCDADQSLIATAAFRARLLLIVDDCLGTVASLLPILREENPALSAFLMCASEGNSANKTFDRVFTPSNGDDFSLALNAELAGVAQASWIRDPALGAIRLIVFGIVAIAAWQLFVIWFHLPLYLFPPPLRVWEAFAANPASFLSHVGTTALEAGVGFLVGNLLAAAATIVLFRVNIARTIFMPVFVAAQAVPIMAIAPLLVVWLGTGVGSKIVMAAIICFFPLLINSLQTFSTMDKDFLQLFQFHRAGYFATLRHLLVPASFPAIVAALRISGALAVVGAIVAEFTGAQAGLGYLLLVSTYRLETDIMFVAILLSAALGITFFHLPLVLAQFAPHAWRRRLATVEESA